ncbi:hypothetical protein IWW34DRAFT_754492 [Fusarium oxysporum f. sp. albedinis]|nr:hypothetical protein IWW34DRAFT_754492 [Fusarium oxysporum f. sp. albedinis]KAK2471404.1 hypothetical protein H9L39_17635 [Fusarium oxysporum f. sp. albedinis]
MTAALASILLAVCHAPDLFADRCRQSFQDAVRLLKNSSQQGQISRRLWRSIRGTINRALSLESPLPSSTNAAAAGILGEDENTEPRQLQSMTREDDTNWSRNATASNINMDDSMADMFGLENDLLNLFSAFEQDNMLKMGQVNRSFDERGNDQFGAITQNDDLNRYNGIF